MQSGRPPLRGNQAEFVKRLEALLCAVAPVPRKLGRVGTIVAEAGMSAGTFMVVFVPAKSRTADTGASLLAQYPERKPARSLGMCNYAYEQELTSW